ncbi:hypothetical protein HDU87_001862 [Geranomyces variabilis]|uniref:Uncharacterized protein n=1 Tax=Geranomyces variabilis TaxID=109894 RepID=A0AAD5TPI2_9FUNG|nr:hypothetical protein HDU87_001862 [Geranomyces variabilis]
MDDWAFCPASPGRQASAAPELVGVSPSESATNILDMSDRRTGLPTPRDSPRGLSASLAATDAGVSSFSEVKAMIHSMLKEVQALKHGMERSRVKMEKMNAHSLDQMQGLRTKVESLVPSALTAPHVK